MDPNREGAQYEVKLLRYSRIDPINDNVDVYVRFADGRNYVATFFTLKNIQEIMDKDRMTGDACGGRYFWAADMVIVNRLDLETVQLAVEDLIREGWFESAFKGPLPAEENL